MTALTQDTLRRTRGGDFYQDTMTIGTGSTVYEGSQVNRINSTGRVVAATAATGRRYFGLVVRLDDDTNGPGAGTGVGNTSGTQKALVRYGDEHLMTIATAIRTNTSLGLNVFVSDDATVAGTAVGSAGTRVAVGELVDWEASDKSTGWVASRRFAKTDIAV